ncbi:MAG TPA: hypothetical protein VJL35_05445 [Gemmatimonadaceae bacterium]|nr:hypothetical protein [Gemmatimonadaceae bacterium]
MSVEASENSLINLAGDTWRLLKLVERILTKLDAGDAQRYIGQLRYFKQQIESNLETAGFKLVNVEGQPFEAGTAASAINIGDFAAEDELLVDQMLEPIIMGVDGIRKQGTVKLRKVIA